MKITTTEMEVIMSKHFGFRANLIVPNISWGMGLHECDLLVMTKSGYATEVEIKISKADLKKDKEKGHGHVSKRIKKFYYAIPEYLGIDFALEHIPDRAGLIIVNEKKRAIIIREAEVNNQSIKFTSEEMFNMARLGTMRIWGLKEKNIKLKLKLKN